MAGEMYKLKLSGTHVWNKTRKTEALPRKDGSYTTSFADKDHSTLLAVMSCTMADASITHRPGVDYLPFLQDSVDKKSITVHQFLDA